MAVWSPLMRSEEVATVEVLESLAPLPVVKAEAVMEEALVVVPVKVWEYCPAPDAKVRFLPVAMVTSPFKETAPVPVEKVVAPV